MISNFHIFFILLDLSFWDSRISVFRDSWTSQVLRCRQFTDFFCFVFSFQIFFFVWFPALWNFYFFRLFSGFWPFQVFKLSAFSDFTVFWFSASRTGWFSGLSYFTDFNNFQISDFLSLVVSYFFSFFEFPDSQILWVVIFLDSLTFRNFQVYWFRIFRFWTFRFLFIFQIFWFSGIFRFLKFRVRLVVRKIRLM